MRRHKIVKICLRHKVWLPLLAALVILTLPLAIAAEDDWVYSTVSPKIIWLQRIESTDEDTFMILRVRWSIESISLGEGVLGFRYKEETLRLPFPDLEDELELADWFEDNASLLVEQARIQQASERLSDSPTEVLRAAAATGASRANIDSASVAGDLRGAPRITHIATVVSHNLSLERPLEISRRHNRRNLTAQILISENLRERILDGSLTAGDTVLVHYAGPVPIATVKVYTPTIDPIDPIDRPNRP